MTDEMARILGRIEGKLDMVIDEQKEIKGTVAAVDNRLRAVERKSAVLGAGAGALVSVGVALIIEKGKRTIGF